MHEGIFDPMFPRELMLNFWNFALAARKLRVVLKKHHWFVVVGHQNTGKTTLCQTLGLHCKPSLEINTDDEDFGHHERTHIDIISG